MLFEITQGINQSVGTTFILLGFQGSPHLRNSVFALFTVIYVLTICGNLLLITLVSYNKDLQSPMYFFLTQLSMNDILLTTYVVPILLYILLNDGGTISFIGCITQLFFFSTSGTNECLLLTVMSYDRYLAICNPLNYTSIMNNEYCTKLAVVSWTLSAFIMLVLSTTTSMLQFCGQNIIDHFICDFIPLLKISCSGANMVYLEVVLLSVPFVIFPCIIIIVSYINIITTILSTPSATSRMKTFSTCSSHLTVVSIYFGTILGVYLLPPNGQSLRISKIASLIYTVITPLINPIIYSLRNKDIKGALHKTIKKNIFCESLAV